MTHVQAPLTERQRAILSFVEDCIRRRGFPPTLREIGEAFHIASTNGVSDHLRALERKGYITRDGMISRGIRVVGLDVPLPAREPAATRIIVDRQAFFTAVAELASLAEWMPGPMLARYEEALAELRVQLDRNIPAPESTTEVAA